MTHVSVLIQKTDNLILRMTVEMEVDKAVETTVKIQPDGFYVVCPKYPDSLASAIEAACLSGAFYALRKIDAMHKVGFGYTVSIGQASGVLDEDFTPCATAVFVGIAYATLHQEIVTPDELEGWAVIDYKISHLP